MNLISKMRENWVTVIAVFLAIAAAITLFLVLWAYSVLVAEQDRWDEYSEAHHCKPAAYSVPYRSYECDDGFTYDRMESK